jgi:hypothetical protein
MIRPIMFADAFSGAHNLTAFMNADAASKRPPRSSGNRRGCWAGNRWDSSLTHHWSALKEPITSNYRNLEQTRVRKLRSMG